MKVRSLGVMGLICLVVVWLFTTVAAYYVYHKPFSPDSVLVLPESLRHVFGETVPISFNAILNVLGDVGTVAVVILVAIVVGHRLSERFAFDSPLEALVVWTGIGLGALGLVTFALACAGFLSRWGYWILVLICFLVLRNDLRAVWHALQESVFSVTTRSAKLLAFFCFLTLAITFLFSLAPPWGWDGIQYHLLTPKLILENGRIVAPPDNLSLNNPNLVEMLFLLGMVLKGDGATQGLHWIYLPLTLGAMLVCARRYFSERLGWMACALFCAVPTIVLLATWAYNDLALTFYSFAAFVFTLRAKETGSSFYFVLVGVLCGFAFGEKVTAFFVPIALAVLLVREPDGIRKTILMLAIAGALAAPWWVRNLVFVGNPVYPFVFGGKYWDAFRTMWYTRFGTGLMQRPLELLIVPWTMTVKGTQSDLFQGTLGPLLLALLPFNLLKAQNEGNVQRTVIRSMWFIVAVLYLVWLLGVAQSNLLWQSRLLLPAFPFLCLLAALGFEKLRVLTLPHFSIQRFTTMVVGLVIGLTAVSYTLAFLGDRAPGYFLGAVSRDEYLTGMLGEHYRTAQWVNAHLPDRSKILFLWEPRTYYFEHKTEADAILDRFVHLHFLYRDADAIARVLHAEGYTHVLLYREGLDNILQSGFDPITGEDVEALREFVADDLAVVYGRADLGLEIRNGKFGLAEPRLAPYSVYEIKIQ